MRKSIIVVTVVSLAISIFGVEPGEVVRLYRAALTNDAASREFTELITKNSDFVSEALPRMNGVELLLMFGAVDSVSSTPTHLIITFKADWHTVRRGGKRRETGEYVENNEALILAPDEEVSIGAYGGGVTLTPISFKNGEKGFRLKRGTNQIYAGGGVKRDFAYLALGDTPIPMSADDVEMIWDSKASNTGEPIGWRRFEGDQVMAYPPPLETPPPAPQANPPEPPAVVPPEPVETPDIVAEDEGRAKPSPPSRLWLYVLIPLCLFTFFYFMRRKKANN